MDLEKKDFDALMSKVEVGVKDTVKHELEATVKGLVNAEDLAAKFEALGLSEDAISGLTKAVEEQGIEMRKLFDEKINAPKTLSEELNEKADEIRKIASGELRSLKLELKTDVTRALVSGTTQAMRLTGVGQIQTQNNVIAGLFRQATVGANSNGVIRYVDQAARTNNAASVAEGAVKPESAISWIEKSLTIEKVADTIPVTMEAFNDVDFISSEIRRLLEVNLALTEDALLWSGNGATPNIEGIYTIADTYTPVAAAIADASIYDLIVKVQASIAGATKYQPRTVVMNQVDVTNMKLKKDDNNNYVLPPFVSADGNIVNGAVVVTSNTVTADTMLVGDFDYATLYRLGGVTIDMGWIDKQFVENMMTLRAEYREALLVRSVDEGAFNKVTGIAAALVTLAS